MVKNAAKNSKRYNPVRSMGVIALAILSSATDQRVAGLFLKPKLNSLTAGDPLPPS
jgi:hypothetical protein